MQQGDLDKAADYLKQALAADQKRSEKATSESSTYMSNLARIYEQRANWEEAKKLYQSALEIREKTEGDDPTAVAATLRHYAKVLRQLNLTAEADTADKRAEKIEDAAGE
jgi:tetratricopeptide (TPR) repeat protein